MFPIHYGIVLKRMGDPYYPQEDAEARGDSVNAQGYTARGGGAWLKLAAFLQSSQNKTSRSHYSVPHLPGAVLGNWDRE